MREHNANALNLAIALDKHPKISRVLYPGLPHNPDFELAKRQMHGFGGMVTIEVKGGRAAAEKVTDNKSLLLATSLGGVKPR